MLRDVLSADEAAALRDEVRPPPRARWSAHHPLVCFQHDAYSGHAGLNASWQWLDGEPGAGARGCFTQAASRAVADSLPRSESLFVYRGQEEQLDELAHRVQRLAGLHHGHAHSWQLLSYEAGRNAGYAEHTDCG